MNSHEAIASLLIFLQVVCLAGIFNNHFASEWVREEIYRKFYGERRVTPLWVKPLWGRWIAKHLDGE